MKLIYNYKTFFLAEIFLLLSSGCIWYSVEESPDNLFKITSKSENENIIETPNLIFETKPNGNFEISNMKGEKLAQILPNNLECEGQENNRSFELLYDSSILQENNNGNLLYGWDFDPNSVSISGNSDSEFVINFELDKAKKAGAFAKSPLFIVDENSRQYKISVEWNEDGVISPKGKGGYGLWLEYFSDENGKKLLTYEVLQKPHPSELKKWQMIENFFMPPPCAKAFKLFFRARDNCKGNFSIRKIKLFKSISKSSESLQEMKWHIARNYNNCEITLNFRKNDYIGSTKFIIEKNSPVVRCETQIKYLRDTKVIQEYISIQIPDIQGKILNRTLKMEEISQKKFFSDYYTPKILSMQNGFNLTGNDDAMGMFLEQFNGSTQIKLFLDNFELHPFFRFPKSLDGQKTQKVNYSQTIRKKGDSNKIHFDFAISNEFLPIWKSRLPNGFDAAMAISQHADGDRPERTLAICFGTNDKNSPEFGKKGFLGHGLVYSKSVFPIGTSPQLFSTYDTLYQHGFEIIPHSVKSDGNASREEVLKGLELLKKYNSKNWIDHSAGGGLSHWEDLASQGSISDSEFYILDILKDFEYKYAWSYIDYELEKTNLNIFFPQKKEKATPILWSNNQFDPENKIRLWASMGTDYKVDQNYCKENIDKLINERGIFIGHEYFGHKRSQGHAWIENNGIYEISPQFDQNLEYISKKKEEGRLWVTTVSELLDYLTIWEKVHLSWKNKNTFLISNNSSSSIKGLTIYLSCSFKKATLDGNNVEILNENNNSELSKIILPEIPSQSSKILEIEY